ncbi:DNA phosphorothioation-dependent restriction protein DptH [Alteromonas sp. S167]|uniref:DNA phosphorothioation-dependent restriction protein DptH n=1 Tax=Alteromonas sp. S167 TaxID=3117402 RepID=UPI002FDF85D9
MSVKPHEFEEFIVANLLEWAQNNVKPGFRYQFKSPNSENSEKLYNALVQSAAGNFLRFTSEKHGETIELPLIQVNEVQLIPLLHSDNERGFTENFISHLRDEVAKPQGPLSKACLVILHNSKLDTIVNSARNLAQPGCIWSNEVVKELLAELISGQDKNKDISKVLLDYQFDAIKEGNATLFGFDDLYKAIRDGDLKFDELFLLEDPSIHEYEKQPKQLRKRLDENRKLYKEIELEVREFPNQLEDRLGNKFSSKFIKSNFPKGDEESWKHVTFEEYSDELKRNKKQTLSFAEIEFDKEKYFCKTKGSSAAQRRELHTILKYPADSDSLSLDILWNGGDLETTHLSTPNKLLPYGSTFKVVYKGAKTSRTRLTVPLDGKPIFFTIGTGNRDKSSDKYKLHFLLVPEGQFNIAAIKSIFLLEPKKRLIRLLTNDTCIAVNPRAYSTLELNEVGQKVPWDSVKAIDYSALSEKHNDVEFSVLDGENRLDFVVEGEVADSALTLPLIFDKERMGRILDDDYYGVFNRDKDKVIIDNKEVLLITERLVLMRLEARFVDEEILALDEVNETTLSIKELEDVDEKLYQAYRELYEYCRARASLPSLLSWGLEFRNIVKKLISSYQTLLNSAVPDQVLSYRHKQALRIGLIKQKDSELLSPFHPIVLSYFLSLTERFQEDKFDAEKKGGKPSFQHLPKVTLNRLNPRGLIPYLYDKEYGFSHVNVSDKNAFWLEAIPHENSQYDFVTKLAKEKINEFQTAFRYLFESREQSKLILNAVNQGNCRELFQGIVDYFKEHLEGASYVHVNIYDKCLTLNSFDFFSESTNSDDLKEFLGIATKSYADSADSIIELLRTRLTYSKFNLNETTEYEYSHIAFFYNDEKVDCIPVNIDSKPSGIAADGLLGGESSESQHGSYHTAFGLRDVNYDSNQLLQTAKAFGSLIRPAREVNTQYSGKDALALAVNEDFKKLLDKTCDSSIWTTIIDPKVTLEFFNAQDKVLIHYSDQYTSSAGFDAITVSRQKDLFIKVLELGKGTKISDFNAFNGDWLLKMLTSPAAARLGMEGEIGAYKLATTMLNPLGLVWVPISVGELVRVSRNIGLKLLDSELSAANAGHVGAMSDDVLMVGLKNQTMHLIPVEVKTGSTPDYRKAKEQVINLRNHLESQLRARSLKGKLYRALFFKQVLAQIDKYKLYDVFPDTYFDNEIASKNEWLRGEYHLENAESLPSGMVISYLSQDTVFEPDYREEEGILLVDLPIALLPSLVRGSLKEFIESDGLPSYFKLPEHYGKRKENEDLSSETHQNAEMKQFDGVNSKAKSVIENEHSEKKNQAKPSDSLKVLIGHNVQNDREVLWEPTNTAKFMNTNSGIIGTMGTGKTQCTKSVVTQLHRNQQNNVDGKPIGILIFDYKSDYVDDKFINATSGKKYNLFRLPYNPLSLFGDTPMLPVHTARGFSETMAKAFNLGQRQQLKLRQLIAQAYDLAGISKADSSTWNKLAPTIADVWELFLESGPAEDSLYAALESLHELEVFESDVSKCASLYELIDGITVIELAGYPNEIQNLVVALTLDLFYSQMQKQGKPLVQGDFRQVTKLILVDEADNFMSQNFPSLRKILKEGREYGVGVILSTQDITHFKTGDNDYSAYILSWIVHRVSQIKNQDIKSLFNKDDKTDQEYLMKSIRELEKHHSLYVDGDKKITKIKDMAFWELSNDYTQGQK